MYRYTLRDGSVISYQDSYQAYLGIVGRFTAELARQRLAETLILITQMGEYGPEFLDEQVAFERVIGAGPPRGPNLTVDEKIDYILTWSFGWSDPDGDHRDVILAILDDSDVPPSFEDFETWLFFGGDLLIREPSVLFGSDPTGRLILGP